MQGFWNGFEKRALMSTKNDELLAGAGASLLPLGTIVHSGMAERPKDHSRGMEWFKRFGGSVLGGTVGGGLAHVMAKGRHMGATRLGVAAGKTLGHGVGHNSAVSKYYDEKGNLKKKYT